MSARKVFGIAILDKYVNRVSFRRHIVEVGIKRKNIGLACW